MSNRSSAFLKIDALQILDSRGQPTVQVNLTTKDGLFRAMVPAGASKGTHEAVEKRDESQKAFGGKGVLQAVSNIISILGPALKNSELEPWDQPGIDQLLCDVDGSEQKDHYGANAILGLSMACARAGAAAKGLELYQHLANLFDKERQQSPVLLPTPCFNVINGGVHSGNPLAPQEFMIVPAGAKSFTEAIQMGAETYQELKKLIERQYGKAGTGVGDEGGFAPPIATPEEALELLTEAVDKAGYRGKVRFAIDPASNEFYQNGKYNLDFKLDKDKQQKDNVLSSEALAERYRRIIQNFDVILLEDPFAEEDWNAWSSFRKDCSVELVGDDLLATNVKRIRLAVERNACNSLLLKINQIGTISEAMNAAREAYANKWSVFVSHRSGETIDDFIADLTVAIRAGHLKSGAPCRGERLAKYNRLLEIEHNLSTQEGKHHFAGLQSFQIATK